MSVAAVVEECLVGVRMRRKMAQLVLVALKELVMVLDLAKLVLARVVVREG